MACEHLARGRSAMVPLAPIRPSLTFTQPTAGSPDQKHCWDTNANCTCPHPHTDADNPGLVYIVTTSYITWDIVTSVR